MKQRKTHLLIIDPQNDFCDLPESYRPNVAAGIAKPALPVTGAHADMQRVAELIRLGGPNLTNITVTLDSHQHLDIAHPTFWIQANGNGVAPFTQIRAEDVKQGRYLPRIQGAMPRVMAYLDALEAAGRYVHMVWPVHCEIGTWGHNVHEDVRTAYNAWEETTLGTVTKVVKGTNAWTEHYSAIRAEVPDENDPATQTNAEFIAHLKTADCIYITGEAGSHCVKATTEHIAEQLGAGEIGKLVVLADCMSPVGGFEDAFQTFIADMRTRGARIASAAEAIAELNENH